MYSQSFLGPKMRLQPGLHPDPAGEFMTLPRPLSWWEGGSLPLAKNSSRTLGFWPRFGFFGPPQVQLLAIRLWSDILKTKQLLR